MAIDIGRRQFISALGSTAVAWPLAARAQAQLPIIGYLAPGTPEGSATWLAAVRKGLAESGMVEGKDFTSEFRSAGNIADHLPGLAAELVQRRVAVIVPLGNVGAARAAKAATAEIPVVFTVGVDPVQAGLVASLNHPGGNITGISTMNLDIGSKHVALLHELLPVAKRFAVLINIENPEAARSTITGTQAALTIGMQTEVVFASNEFEIDTGIGGLGARAQALIIQPDALFAQNLQKLAEVTIHEKLPALYALSVFPKAGGLMSYGSDILEAHRKAGIYVSRILKGEKPSELPVQQATKFEFVINLKTAKAIGIDIPPILLARTDEVIE
jgi:putative ABC transport system substrate-binding protein